MSLETSILNRKKSNFKLYGNRTSSLLSLYPHLKTHFAEDGEAHLSFIETKKSFIVASEPMSRLQERKEFILEFFKKIDQNTQKRKVIFPISKNLAQQLEKNEFHVMQIGVEPIFNLAQYFDKPFDVTMEYPLARALKKRGGIVRELAENEIAEHQEKMEKILTEWKEAKSTKELGFLNRVDPFYLDDFKRFFVLEDRGDIRAFLTASPIFLNHEIIGYFFNDIIRGSMVRAGSNDLLILEAMRILHLEGVAEVRLGMCPLAELDAQTPHYKILSKLYQHFHFGYSFKNLHAFKKKLNPTRFEPLYLASSSDKFTHILSDIVSAHYPEKTASILWRSFLKTSKRSLILKDHAKPMLQAKTKKTKHQSFVWDFFKRTKITLSLTSIFLALHGVKNFTSWGKSYFDQVGYETSRVTLDGIFMGSLFHNHAFHLIGDLLSFLVFGGAVEYFFGTWIFMLLTSMGLWLSNPLTHFFIWITIPQSDPAGWVGFLQEKDYGTSNAVFALVGAVIYSLKSSLWLVAPFIFHGIYIILQRESLLAFHHLLAMYMGYSVMLWYNQKTNAQNLQCE